MQLTKILISLLLAISHGAFAQSDSTPKVEIIGADKLYAKLYEETAANIDTLSNLNQKGVLFVKFSINKKEEITDLRFSRDEPAILKNIIYSVLQSLKLKSAMPEGTAYILPILYEYLKPLTGNAADILKTVPAVDISKLSPESFINEFTALTGIERNKEKVYGVPSVFLPWLTFKGKIQ